MLSVDMKKTVELKKHVAAIHSAHQLTLVQRKIANALLYNAYDSLLEKDEHHIHINDLCELIGYDSKDYKKIRNSLVALISTAVEWNLIDGKKIDGDGVWNASSIIADASIDGPICSYSYSKRMKRLLYRPELYGRLNMQILARFKSTYGLALYENCVRYQDISHTAKFELSVFRKLMGVGEQKYAIFRDFKRRVLDKAIEEVNKYSPITVEVRIEKRRNQVHFLQFLIKKSTNLLLTYEKKYINEEVPLASRLRKDYGFTNKQAQQVTSEYDQKYILEKISIIETSSSFQNGKIKNLAKYLEKALIDDYQPPKSSMEIVKKLQNEKEKKAQDQEKKQEQLEKYRQFSNRKVFDVYNGAQGQLREKLEDQFSNYIKQTMYYSVYMKEGLENILVRDRFCDYLRRHKQELLEGIISFDEFAEQGMG